MRNRARARARGRSGLGEDFLGFLFFQQIFGILPVFFWKKNIKKILPKQKSAQFFFGMPKNFSPHPKLFRLEKGATDLGRRNVPGNDSGRHKLLWWSPLPISAPPNPGSTHLELQLFMQCVGKREEKGRRGKRRGEIQSPDPSILVPMRAPESVALFLVTP